MPMVKITVVVTELEAKRIDALKKLVYDGAPEQRARGPLQRSDVVRLGLAHGLRFLEEQYHPAFNDTFEEAIR